MSQKTGREREREREREGWFLNVNFYNTSTKLHRDSENMRSLT
jgi:hypothetical protein